MTPDRAGVFGGVDTHKDVHVAAAVDAAGRLLGTAEFAADSRGYDQLAGWLESWGAVGRVGVEGTGSYGAGLTRHLAAAGVEVVEVNRPNRQTRRRRGKTDTVDAETAARAALNGDATAVPKSADGCVEAIRTLSLARRSAVKARTVAANQINAVAVTAPEHLRDRLRGLKTPEMVKVCARWRLDAAGDPAARAAKRALRALASRHRALTAEIKGLDTELLALCERANPALLGTCEPPWLSRRVLSLGKREYGYAYTDISGTSFHEEVLGHREGPGGAAGSPAARRVGHRPRDRQTGGGTARLWHGVGAGLGASGRHRRRRAAGDDDWGP